MCYKLVQGFRVTCLLLVSTILKVMVQIQMLYKTHHFQSKMRTSHWDKQVLTTFKQTEAINYDICIKGGHIGNILQCAKKS